MIANPVRLAAALARPHLGCRRGLSRASPCLPRRDQQTSRAQQARCGKRVVCAPEPFRGARSGEGTRDAAIEPFEEKRKVAALGRGACNRRPSPANNFPAPHNCDSPKLGDVDCKGNTNGSSHVRHTAETPLAQLTCIVLRCRVKMPGGWYLCLRFDWFEIVITVITVEGACDNDRSVVPRI